jgi:DNA polymerase-3 subunit epsilon
MDGGARFAALDFETADYGRDSACSVGVIVVEGATIVERAHFLIRPPRRQFVFTWLHGIAWEHVADQPTFGVIWPRIARLLEGTEFVAAHSAAFDRSVLYNGCHAAGLPMPELPFRCTVQLARRAWGLRSATLPNVCRHLGIALTQHHQAEADAEACAHIVLAARAAGHPLGRCLGPFRGRLVGRR